MCAREVLFVLRGAEIVPFEQLGGEDDVSALPRSLAHKLARRLKAGSVWINTYHRIETSCPFGGYKMSGYGRENGVGMVNYLTRTKSVAVDLNDFVMDLFA